MADDRFGNADDFVLIWDAFQVFKSYTIWNHLVASKNKIDRQEEHDSTENTDKDLW